MSVPTSWAAALSQAENSSQRDPELWAKCFTQANGDEGVAKAAYVNALMTSAKPTNHHPVEGTSHNPCFQRCASGSTPQSVKNSVISSNTGPFGPVLLSDLLFAGAPVSLRA